MPTPTEMFVPKDRNEIFNVALVNEKTDDFSLIGILDHVQPNSNMSLAISQRAGAAVRRNQLLSRSLLSLAQQRGPIRWVSAVPGQKPGSDQYVHFTLEEQCRQHMLMASLQCPLSRGAQ
jgi:hypothetical protein